LHELQHIRLSQRALVEEEGVIRGQGILRILCDALADLVSP
jgi:hypothetical protein